MCVFKTEAINTVVTFKIHTCFTEVFHKSSEGLFHCLQQPHLKTWARVMETFDSV